MSDVLFCPDLASQGYRAEAVDAIASAGRCVWNAENLPVQATTTTTQPLPLSAQLPAQPPAEVGAGGLLVMGIAGLIVVGGCVAGAMLSYRWRPAPAQPVYLLPPHGNSPHGILEVQPMEFAGNSMEFAGNSQDDEGNSQDGQDANSLGIPQVSADSQQWPPSDYAQVFDPMRMEQPGEFEFFQRLVEQTGLNPKGNDIIKRVWGVNPGRSEAFQRARDRRDTYAKRLEYYRSEGYFS